MPAIAARSRSAQSSQGHPAGVYIDAMLGKLCLLGPPARASRSRHDLPGYAMRRPEATPDDRSHGSIAAFRNTG